MSEYASRNVNNTLSKRKSSVNWGLGIAGVGLIAGIGGYMYRTII